MGAKRKITEEQPRHKIKVNNRRKKKSQLTPQRVPLAKSRQEHKPVLKRVTGWVWGLVVAFSGLIAYASLWPQLSINPDFSFDSQNAFNTSFSVTNEGLLPLTDLSVTCTGNFVMHADGNQFSGNLGTSTDYPNFSKRLTFKRRLSLPCNHNVVANGHPIDPGATLGIKIRYRILGLPISKPQIFNFLALAGADKQLHWAYTD